MMCYDKKKKLNKTQSAGINKEEFPVASIKK